MSLVLSLESILAFEWKDCPKHFQCSVHKKIEVDKDGNEIKEIDPSHVLVFPWEDPLTVVVLQKTFEDKKCEAAAMKDLPDSIKEMIRSAGKELSSTGSYIVMTFWD